MFQTRKMYLLRSPVTEPARAGVFRAPEARAGISRLGRLGRAGANPSQGPENQRVVLGSQLGKGLYLGLIGTPSPAPQHH